MNPEQFFAHFNFRPELRFALGLEHEAFLTDGNDRPVPQAPTFLEGLGPDWGPELSACQVEFHPANPMRSIGDLVQGFKAALVLGKKRARAIGLEYLTQEVAPADMPFDVYPLDRYRRIVGRISRQQFEAACRVASTQLHIGVGSLTEAIAVYNHLVARLDELVELGDESEGRRLELYKVMAVNWQPPVYESTSHFFKVACEQGFAEDPRSCYHLVRISRHGSVELRMFDATEDVSKLTEWAKLIQSAARLVL